MSNELVFKLRVDGAAPTATGVAAVGAALDTLAGKGPAVSSALGSVGDALTANQSAQAAYLLGLREQIQLFGKSSIEIERYKAAQLGVGAAAAPLILQLQNQRAAQELAARAARDEAAAAREAASAKKAAEASQASFVRSLQEQVAVQGKSQADLLRYRAAQLGVAKDAEQYIAAIEKSSKTTLGLSISAGQATAAMRQLPAQFTDIATQLAGGQSPFLILLQQGGQIKDSFGGVGNAIKALGSVISPVGLVIGAAAATVGVLAIAYNKGAEESLAFTRSIILSGNAAGVTRDQLSGMATEVAKIAGNESSAAAALAALAGGGQVAASGLQLAARAAIQLEREGVQSVDKTAKAFADLAREPLAASLRLNEGVNYLTVSVIEQIRTLEQQGRAADAAAVAQNAYAASGIKNTDQLKAALGPLDTLLRGATEEWGKFWAGAAGIGRAETAADRIKELRGQLAQLGPGQKDFALSFLPGVESADQKRAQLAQLEASQAAKNAEAERAAEVTKTTQAYIKATEANKKYTDLALTGAEKVNKALQEYRRNVEAQNKGLSSSGLPAIAAAEMARVEKSIRESFAGPKGSSAFADLTREFEQQRRAIDQRVESGGKLSKAEELEIKLAARLEDARGKLTKAQLAGLQVEAQQLVAAQRRADTAERDIQNAQQEVRNVDAMRQLREEGEREITEWLRKQDEERRKGLESITARVQAVKDEEEAVARARAANISLAEAVEQVAIARLEESRAAKVNDPAALAAIENEIKARRELMGLLGTKAAREANDAAAKDALTVWQRTADQISQSLTDALMQGGKSAWEYIKGLFRSTVLRPIVQAVVAPLTGALATGANAMSGTGAAGGGDLFTSGVNLYSAGQKLYEGFSSGFASIGSSVSAGVNSASIYSGATYGTGFGTQQSAMLAAQEAGFGSAAGSTGATMGTAASYAAGAAVGVYGGRAISGGYSSLGGDSGNAAVNIGTAIGSYWGPIGAAVGGLIGGAVNRTFGRKAPEIESQILKGFISSGNFSGETVTNIIEKGGIFRSDKRTQTTEAITGDLDKALDAGATQLRALATKYGDALGLPASALADVSQSISVQIGNDAEANKKAITDALQQYADALIGTFAKDVEPLRKAGETTAQVIERVGGNLLQVNDLFGLLGLTLLDTSVAGGTAATALSDIFGGLGQLGQTAGQYYAAYYSEAERAAKATEGITATLSKVGIALPSTRDEFRKLVEAQDLTTTSGQQAFAALLQVNGAFAELVPASEAAAAGLTQAAEALRGQLASAIDQNIGKFLSSTQMTARQYSNISNDLVAVGIQVDVGQLIGLSKDQIGELASAFLASAEASDTAKLAVVTAAGALADLKDQAAAAALALSQQLGSAIDANVDKFLTPRERVDRQAAGLSNRLASVGINIGADELLSTSIEQIGQAASAFVNAAGASVEAKVAVVEVAGALVDLKESLRQVEIQEFVDGLGVSVDELTGAYNELVPASDNLVQSWRKNRTEMEGLRDALDEISGTKAVSALDQLRNTISQRDALQGVVGGIDSQIGALRAGTGDASALAYLRQREAQLWAEFASTKNPAVAQAITDNTLQRIKLEGTLQAQANQSQISALKEQIAAAERLRDLAAQMGQFIQGLRAGTLSNLSSAGRLDVQRGLFQQAISSGGDVQGQAQAYLQQAQQQFGGSTAQYSAVFEQVTAQLAALGLSGMGAGQQITDAQAQINALTSVADTSLQQITALEQLRTSFSGDVADLNASIETQTGVLRESLTQLETTVTNQERQIIQFGEGLTRLINAVDNLATGSALSNAQSDALGVTA